MLCHKDVGLWIDLGYIMRVENSANSIVQVSHNIGKALQQKESQQVKTLFEILKLNWYAVRPGGGGGEKKVRHSSVFSQIILCIFYCINAKFIQ